MSRNSNYREPSHYFDVDEVKQKLYIKRTIDNVVSFSFNNTMKGHKAAAKKMLSLEKSEREIHQLLLFHSPQHVKDNLNGKATIQPEFVRSETSRTRS